MISSLTQSDLETAYQLECLCHTYPWSREVLASNQGERYLNLKIMDGTNMVGFMITQVVLDEATIFNLAIHPSNRRAGKATELLYYLFKQLRQRQVNTVWLEVRASNDNALHLYNKIGFNQVTVRKNYYPAQLKQEDAIVMAYHLSTED